MQGADGRKMSKSRGNVVSPTGYIEKFGADATRLFVLFAGPVERDFAWNDAQVEGLHRFLVRVWRLIHRFHGEVREAGPPPREAQGRALELRRAAHRALKRVTEDLERIHFNTAISALMELVNALTEQLGGEAGEQPLLGGPEEQAALRESFEVLAVGLSPFTPHFSDEDLAGARPRRNLQGPRGPSMMRR